MIFDRRRRKKIPLSLLVFGVLLLLLPLYNFIGVAQKLRVPLNYPEAILLRMSWPEIILLFAAWPVACGFLLGKKWGWWSFLLYGGCLIAYDLYAALLSRHAGSWAALVQASIVVGIILFVSRPDISAPFFRTYPRGWRMQKRHPARTSVWVDGVRIETRDISPRGVYLTAPLANVSPGSQVAVQIEENGETLAGAVVRTDADGTGIAFRGLDSSQKKRVERWVREVTDQGGAGLPARAV